MEFIMIYPRMSNVYDSRGKVLMKAACDDWEQACLPREWESHENAKEVGIYK